MFYTYILRSKKDNRCYIGFSHDVDRRLIFHNQGLNPSTKHRIPFRLVKYFPFNTKIEAIKYERYLKSLKGGIKFKEIINS